MERLNLEHINFDHTENNYQPEYLNISMLNKEKEKYLNKIKILENQVSLLKLSNTRFSSTINNLHFGILIENSVRKVELVNSEFLKIFGIPVEPKDLAGMDCVKLAEEAKEYFVDPPGFIKRVNDILVKRKRVINEAVHLKDGRTLTRCYVPILNNKMIAGHLWIYNDITEKEQSEELLNSQKEFYETILNSLPSDIAVFDKDHKYLFVNPVGIKDDELRRWIIGKNDFDYCHYKNKPITIAEGRKKLFKSVVKSKRQFEWEEKLVKPDGNTDYYIRRMKPIYDDFGNLKMVIGYGMNINERKKYEKDIVNAKEETERSAQAKETFLANMSHEIRTPMNGILGLTALMLKSDVTDQQKEYLRLMQDSANNLLGLINDILDLEKISQEKIILEKIEFSPEKKIKDIMQIFSFAAKEKGIELAFKNKLSGNLLVLGDPTRFVQILNNIFNNAIKFTNQGYVTVYASNSFTENNKCILNIDVIDTGIGISASRINKLFVPFTQAEPEITRKYGGSGLGLAISKNLVNLHKGEIWVESEMNKGSKFSYTLEYDCYKRNSKTKLSEEKVIVMETFEDLQLLLVEDNEINQFLAKTILEGWGINVLTAGNGLEAIKVLQDNKVDIILMDVQMPVMNGIEATQAIRKLIDPEKAGIPVIAVTANAIKGTEKKYYAAGMNDYITKPYTDISLHSAIKKNLLRYKNSDSGLKLKKAGKKKPAEKKLYDLTELHQISKGNNKIIEELIMIFKKTAPQTLSILKKNFNERKFKEVSETAHKLKSTVNTFKIDSVYGILNDIEHNYEFNGSYNEQSMAKDIEKVIITINKVLDTIKID